MRLQPSGEGHDNAVPQATALARLSPLPARQHPAGLFDGLASSADRQARAHKRLSVELAPAPASLGGLTGLAWRARGPGQRQPHHPQPHVAWFNDGGQNSRRRREPPRYGNPKRTATGFKPKFCIAQLPIRRIGHRTPAPSRTPVTLCEAAKNTTGS